MINNLFYHFIPVVTSKIVLIMTRIFSALNYSKIFNNMHVNITTKIILVYLISNLLTPFISNFQYSIYTIDFFVVLFYQVLIGIMIGLLLQFLSACMIFIGEIISSQMGLSFSVFFDLGRGFYSIVISRILNIFFLFLFFIYNAHLNLVVFLVKSFYVFPLHEKFVDQNIFFSIIKFFGNIFISGIKSILPILFFFLIFYIAFMMFDRLSPNSSLFSSFVIIIFICGLILLKYSICHLYFLGKFIIKHLFNYLKDYIIQYLSN
ncbi:Flagellar biosynthetic protein FliR [Buchnera aphidicola (Cinara curtihirsuta)]|nr:Flagellar biosynthetic protein FliR [Buchnera aphidicola (Cinara curtihirsuta)]